MDYNEIQSRRAEHTSALTPGCSSAFAGATARQARRGRIPGRRTGIRSGRWSDGFLYRRLPSLLSRIRRCGINLPAVPQAGAFDAWTACRLGNRRYSRLSRKAGCGTAGARCGQDAGRGRSLFNGPGFGGGDNPAPTGRRASACRRSRDRWGWRRVGRRRRFRPGVPRTNWRN